MSHLAGNRHHHLPGERRTSGARSADSGTRVPSNNQTLRPNKRRDNTERGRTRPVVNTSRPISSQKSYVLALHFDMVPRELQKVLDELEASRSSRKRALGKPSGAALGCAGCGWEEIAATCHTRRVWGAVVDCRR